MAHQDDDAPATKKDLRDLRQEIKQSFATKEDLKSFATKEDLKSFATKEDLKSFATKDDLKSFATKDDLKEFVKTSDLSYLLQNILTAMADMEKRQDEKLLATEGRLIVLVEHWRSDLVDIQNDRFSLHDNRLKRLEIHTGLEPVSAA